MSNYRVGIYLRLSKEDERLGESGSITNQRAILLNYIKEHNLEYIDEYIDDGVSGTTFDRIGFKRMIWDIEEKRINMVITKDTSRLGRDHIDFGYYVEKYFPEHGVRYVAVCDNIDTFYHQNDMLLFKSAYNDMYVKDISNKIRASLNIKKKNGEFVGAYAPYGYCKATDNKHKLVIDEASARVVRKIFKLFLEGNSISKIATILTREQIPIPSVYKKMNRGIKSNLFGIWTTRTITDILKNPTYMGNLTQGRSRKINYKSKKRVHTKKEDWIIVENSCPVIIEKKTFELAQALFEKNKALINLKKDNKVRQELRWKGFIYCKDCQHTIGFRSVFQNTKKNGMVERVYGNCNYYLKKKNYLGCTPHKVRYEELDEKLMEEIRLVTKMINREKLFDKVRKDDFRDVKMNQVQKDIIRLKKEIELEHEKLDSLYEDKLSGFIDESRYLDMDKRIRERMFQKEEEIQLLRKKLEKSHQKTPMQFFDEVFQRYLNDKMFLAMVVDKVFISENREIDIYFKIKNETFEGISCDTIPK